MLKKERIITNKENQPVNNRARRESGHHRKLPAAPKIIEKSRDQHNLITREKPRLNQEGAREKPRTNQVEEMFEMANRLIAKSVTEAWPTLDYEKKLQDKLCKQMKVIFHCITMLWCIYEPLWRLSRVNNQH